MKLKENKTIQEETGTIYLKNLEESNATEEYCNWLNDPNTNQYLDTKSATIEELKQYIKTLNESNNCLFLGIFYKENNKHIGNIKLREIDFDKKTAIFGILIGNKDYRGKGIGAKAIKLICNYGFDVLGLNKIELGVLTNNERAVKAYEKVGFKVVKTFPDRIDMIITKEDII